MGYNLFFSLPAPTGSGVSPRDLLVAVQPLLTPELVNQVKAVFLFKVTGPGGGDFFLDLKNGRWSTLFFQYRFGHFHHNVVQLCYKALTSPMFLPKRRSQRGVVGSRAVTTLSLLLETLPFIGPTSSLLVNYIPRDRYVTSGAGSLVPSYMHFRH